MTDQLWESGRAVDTALAVEKCLTGVLGQTLVGSGAIRIKRPMPRLRGTYQEASRI
jgi:hypothetical protein